MRKNLEEFGLHTKRATYVIAEIGLNHNGDIDMAKRLIESAAKAGADAVKFQTYVTEKRTKKSNAALFDILKRCELPFAAFSELKKHAEACQVTFFSTPFDEESVDCLAALRCDLYKVASFDITNRALLRKVASIGKPVILSVGMAEMAEVEEAYEILKRSTDRLALLHCVSAYPTKPEDSKLENIRTLATRFECVIGQSDHTDGIEVPLLAVAAGAQVIEKHYRLDSRHECVDAPVSITEKQLAQLVIDIRRLEKILGDGVPGVTPAQAGTLVHRRKSE